MTSKRWMAINQLRMNSVVMLGVILVLSVYGLITSTSFFDPIFFSAWMAASIDGTITGIIAMILKNIR